MQTSLALIATLLLIYLCALAVRRLQGGRLLQSESLLGIESSVNVGGKERVVLLRVGERGLLIGVAPGCVSLLTQLDGSVFAEHSASRQANTAEEDSRLECNPIVSLSKCFRGVNKAAKNDG